ncbi:endonuclease/exonuclease/phosphatase family protein [Aeromicrobium sp.]|uniref:endonuclease/exonuclease/phosphatase family protein n=1 Tax=Aeromicrobium sp. TaxID=1871063 RepID=UPI0030BA51E5
MSPVATRSRMRAGALTATASLVLGLVIAVAPPAQAISAPTGIRAAYLATKAVGLTWNVTGENVYRVRFATNAAMTSGNDTWDVRGNYFELTRTDANPSAAYSAPRLTPGKTYYFQVKAVTDEPTSDQRDNLSSYSNAVAVKLPSTGVPELQPVNVKATVGGADTMHLSWRSRGPGVSYVLRYTTDPTTSVTSWRSVKWDVAGGTLKGLDPSKKYWFRARAINASGVGISNYSASPGVTATTTATTPSPALTAISYNIRKMYSTADWAARREAVAANIKGAGPDVLGLQEATPITWATNGKKQYADIMGLLGTQYSLVTTGSGSSGTQLAYNEDRLSVVDSGIQMLFEHGSAERYAVWAVFKDRISSKTFFAVSTHLEPGSQTDSVINDVRIRQARQVVALIAAKSGGRPAVILGDMNSGRSAKPSNGQYGVFTGAGYVDPLDNAVGNWASGANAAAEHQIDTQYNGVNALERRARLTAYPVGTYIDYVYASPSVRVASWRTVVKVDTAGSFVGTIPSDHNLFKLMLHLP